MTTARQNSSSSSVNQTFTYASITVHCASKNAPYSYDCSLYNVDQFLQYLAGGVLS